MNTKLNFAQTLMLTIMAFSLSACATTDTDATRVEDDFGQSVRQMVDAQIYDKEAASNPSTEPPMGMDGVQGEAVLDVYRKHVGDPDEVNESLRIEISD